MALRIEDFEPVARAKDLDDFAFKLSRLGSLEKLYPASQLQQLIDQCNAKDVEIEHLTATIATCDELLKLSRDERDAVNEQLAVAQADNARLREALQAIANWEMPATGEFWDAENTRPVSFENNFGSQGAKAHIRNVATLALATNSPDDALREYGAKLVEKIAVNVKALGWGTETENIAEYLREDITDKIREGKF